MTSDQAKPIRLRFDVDYPYPSRRISFLYLFFGIKRRFRRKDYLKNACIIANMINGSRQNIRAYWFFTPYTIPDEKLLALLNPERHEVGLHVVAEPFREWKILENETDRTVKYYTMHGTERFLTQLMWGRRRGQTEIKVPTDGSFAPTLFQDETTYETYSMDRIIYEKGLEKGMEQVRAWIHQGFIVSMHPEWLFVRGKRSRRGPFYDGLKQILESDEGAF